MNLAEEVLVSMDVQLDKEDQLKKELSREKDMEKVSNLIPSRLLSLSKDVRAYIFTSYEFFVGSMKY